MKKTHPPRRGTNSRIYEGWHHWGMKGNSLQVNKYMPTLQGERSIDGLRPTVVQGKKQTNQPKPRETVDFSPLFQLSLENIYIVPTQIEMSLDILKVKIF